MRLVGMPPRSGPATELQAWVRCPCAFILWSMKRKTYRAGIIGLGFIGGADQVSGDVLGQEVAGLDGTHFSAYSGHPRVSLEAGSSRDEGRRRRFAERSGARTYADWREMLEKEDFDIIGIATYTPVHAEMTIACAERSIPAIYCEKPIASYLDDAERMIRVCREAGCLLIFNHNRRFHENLRKLTKLLRNRPMGKFTSINQQWPTGRFGCVGSHQFDTMRMILDQDVAAVSATLDLAERPDCRGQQFNDPGGWGVMRMQDGTMVTVDAADYNAMGNEIRVNCERGRVIAGEWDEVTFEYWDGRRETWPSKVGEASGMSVAVDEIVQHLDGTAPFPYPGEQAYNTLEAIIACHASHARNGAWVELPLMGEDRKIFLNSG